MANRSDTPGLDSASDNASTSERSPRHPSVKRLRRLVQQAKARSTERAFVVEGHKLVGEALRADLMVQELFVSGDGPAVAELAVEASARRISVHRLSDQTLRSSLDTVNPQPVAAIVERPDRTLDDLTADGPVMVGVQLQDPGNAGAMARTAEAAGCAGLILGRPCVDWTNPKVVRASAGSVLRLPIVVCDLPEAVTAMRSAGRPVVATAPFASARYDEMDLRSAAILLGNEPRGLAPEALALADAVVTIPMAGDVESLNVAATAAVMAFEAARQRRAQQ